MECSVKWKECSPEIGIAIWKNYAIAAKLNNILLCGLCGLAGAKEPWIFKSSMENFGENSTTLSGWTSSIQLVLILVLTKTDI